jgi:hypothetical protein
MANFTQLQLGKNSSPDANKNPQDDRSLSRQKVLFGSGLLAVAAVSGVFLLITNGCSKSAKAPTSIEQPGVASTSVMNPTTSTPVAPVQLPVVAAKPAKKRVQHKAPMATYSQPEYGISFRYPKNYVLKTNDEDDADEGTLAAMRTDFVEPGAVTMAQVAVPKSSYPGTDFTSGFFTASVNSTLTEAQCSQFASVKSDSPEGAAKVKLGGNEYLMVEDAGDSSKGEPHIKYFHHFENGNCYEFSVGLATTDGNVAGLKPVNRSLVFGRLEQIVASAKVKAPAAPEVAKDGQGHPMVEGEKE